MRKFIVTNLIIVIMAFSFIVGYTRTFNISYAAADDWSQVTTNEQLVEAFKYYCKSRDLTIEGSAADAVSSFTTSAYQRIVNKLGLDMNAIQADLKYHTDSNGGLQFLFNQSGLSTYNRIFAQFLQDNDLSVGDSVSDEIIYSGLYYTDPYTNQTCLVYVTDGLDDSTNITAHGTTYMYNWADLLGLLGSETTYQTSGFHQTPTGKTLTLAVSKRTSTNIIRVRVNNSGGYHDATLASLSNGSISNRYNGRLIVYTLSNDTNHLKYFGFLQEDIYSSPQIMKAYDDPISTNYDSDFQNCNIFITTNNNVIAVEQTINEGDSITINNEGDTIINEGNENPDPSVPSDPDSPITPNLPNIPGIELPDLSDLNSVNLFLDGLKDKFPFSIPWDMYLLLAVLNAPPEAPHFEGTVDFKIYEWNYDLDFSEFEQAAQILRALELLSFTMGLILITRNIIRG